MIDKQLQMVANWESEKEQKLGRDFQTAQQHLQQNRDKLAGLQQYRLEYLQQIQQKGNKGVGAMSFSQHQAFIEKLDKACEIQNNEIIQTKQVVDQRKQLWLKQQQKRKAVEMLIDRKQSEFNAKQARIEQQMLDEIALQKFIRKGL